MAVAAEDGVWPYCSLKSCRNLFMEHVVYDTSPFHLGYREVQKAVNTAQGLFQRWTELLQDPSTATRVEIDWTTNELRNNLRSIEWDLEDLDETINILSVPFGPNRQIYKSLSSCLKHVHWAFPFITDWSCFYLYAKIFSSAWRIPQHSSIAQRSCVQIWESVSVSYRATYNTLLCAFLSFLVESQDNNSTSFIGLLKV